MKKLLSTISLILSTIFLTGATTPKYTIDAEANAARHNNIGINYLKEGYYFGAIKEFEIAVNLNPNTQASAVYYNNLGRTYIRIGYPEIAQIQFKKALDKYPLNFEYYKNLIEAYGKLNIVQKKLDYYKNNKKNSLDEITIGLLYGALGQTRMEITVLDEFCNKEPDLIITSAIKKYVQEQSAYLKHNQKDMK